MYAVVKTATKKATQRAVAPPQIRAPPAATRAEAEKASLPPTEKLVREGDERDDASQSKGGTRDPTDDVVPTAPSTSAAAVVGGGRKELAKSD